MNKAIRMFTVLLMLLGFAVGAGFVVGDSSHGGDFTWRQQAIIGMLRTPVYLIGAIHAGLMLAQAYQCRRESAGRGAWFLAAGLVVVWGLIVVVFVHPLDSLIMTWNANVPPEDWHLVRERRNVPYIVALVAGTFVAGGAESVVWARTEVVSA